MKRWLTKLVVFLLFGAIVNVAVAWGCATWVDSSEAGMSYRFAATDMPQGFFWSLSSESARGAQRVLSRRLVDYYMSGPPLGEGNWPPDLIPSWSTISHEIDLAGLKKNDIRMQDARGWPMLSMRCTFLGDEASVDWITVRKVVGGRELPSSNLGVRILPYSTLRALPYIPIPLGFIVNTLFYAAVLWLPFAPFQLRQYVRVKRGHCIKCGYDLRGTSGGEVCPECGVETAAKVVE